MENVYGKPLSDEDSLIAGYLKSVALIKAVLADSVRCSFISSV